MALSKSGTVGYHSAGFVDPAGVSSAGSRNYGLCYGDYLSSVNLAAENTLNLVSGCAYVARGNRPNHGNVPVRLDHDCVERGSIRSGLRFSVTTSNRSFY